MNSLVSALRTERKRLETKSEECQKVRLAVQSSIRECHTVDLGLGYFATLSKFDTLEFLDRTMLRHQNTLNEIDRKLKPAQVLQALLGNLSKAHGVISHEGGLPIVEIQERLDEDGQVLDVSFRDPQGNEMNSHNSVSSISPSLDNDTDSTEYVNLRDEILTDYLQVHAPTSIDQSSPKVFKEHVDAQFNIPKSGSDLEGSIIEEGSNRDRTISLVNQSIYELELLALEADESSEALDNRLDICLISENSWLDADSESDDYEETRFALLVPRNAALQDRLWDEVKSLRSKKAEMEPPATPARSKVPKSVRFSETLDIKTIEDTQTTLSTIPRDKVLRFKSNRLSLSNNARLQILELAEPNNLNFHQGITNDVNENLWDVDREMTKLISVPHSNYEEALEDPASQEDHLHDHDGNETRQHTIASIKTPLSPISGNSREKDISCAKRDRTEDLDILSNHGQESRVDYQRRHASRFREPISKISGSENLIHHGNTPSSPPEKQSRDINAKIERETVIGVVSQLDADHFAPGDETDAMARAYIAGHFDNKRTITGPIVNELKDFEILNGLVASFDTGNPFEEEVLDLNEEMELDKIESDEEILKREIVEKVPESVHQGEISSDILNTFDSVQTSVIQHEIQNEYHRLRQKILAKELTSDQEFEPIDDVPRQSRFKNSRRRSTQFP